MRCRVLISVPVLIFATYQLFMNKTVNTLLLSLGRSLVLPLVLVTLLAACNNSTPDANAGEGDKTADNTPPL